MSAEGMETIKDNDRANAMITETVLLASCY